MLSATSICTAYTLIANGLVDERINDLTDRVTLLPSQPFEFCARPVEFYSYSGRTEHMEDVPLVISAVGNNVRATVELLPVDRVHSAAVLAM